MTFNLETRVKYSLHLIILFFFLFFFLKMLKNNNSTNQWMNNHQKIMSDFLQFLYLICWPFVHSLCTRVFLFYINKLITYKIIIIIMSYFMRTTFSIFFYVEPHQGRALWIHPWQVNHKYKTPSTRTMYHVIQGNS